MVRIFNPAFGVSATSAGTVALQPIDWKADAIALFSNSKPNARELLEGVKAKLAALRPTGNIDYVAKNSASQPAPAPLIEQVAAKYRAALLAIAD